MNNTISTPAPATRIVGSDRYPATIVSVSPSGKTLTVREDRCHLEGGEWVFAPNPSGRTWRFRFTKRGWVCKSVRLHIGHRDYYQDPSF
jgi:hypothetical protein